MNLLLNTLNMPSIAINIKDIYDFNALPVTKRAAFLVVSSEDAKVGPTCLPYIPVCQQNE